jgi:hypothetical protein
MYKIHMKNGMARIANSSATAPLLALRRNRILPARFLAPMLLLSDTMAANA